MSVVPRLERLRSEAVGQQLVEVRTNNRLVGLDEQHVGVLAELAKNLQALAVDRVLARDSQRLNGGETGGDRIGDGHAFRAHAAAVAGVVDGTAGELARPACGVAGDAHGTASLLRVGHVRFGDLTEHLVDEIALVSRQRAVDLRDAGGRRKQLVDVAATHVAVVVDDVEENRVLAELAQDLTAQAAGRAAGVLAADDGDVGETSVAFEDGCGGGVALSTDGRCKGVVLHVASDERAALSFGIDGDDSRADGEIGLEAMGLVGTSPGLGDELTFDCVEGAVGLELSEWGGH